MTGAEEGPPVDNRWGKIVRAARETRRGRFLFIVGLCLLGTWMWTLVFWFRDLLLSGRISWDRTTPLSESFNVDGVRGHVSQLASGVPYEWWAILGSVLALVLCFLGARFLDGTRGRAAWNALGLRGQVSRQWKWLACLVLLPAVARIVYVYLGTEPATYAPRFGWKVYFFPYSALEEGVIRWGGMDARSSRPGLLLQAMLEMFAYTILLYGLAWPRLRRLGIGFLGTAIFLVLADNAVRLILSYLPQFEMWTSSWDVAGGLLIFLAMGVVQVLVSGWVVERWGGRVWPLVIAVLAPRLPELLVDIRYLGAVTTSPFESYSASVLLLSVWGLMPLVLLALLTLLGPRLGLPPLRGQSAIATPVPAVR